MARRILIVEDDAMIAGAVRDRLESEGHDVDIAVDGELALLAAVVAPPDAVILDLGLPGIDGLEVCRRLQRDRHVPVIMLTARDDEADLLTGLAVGADDYLTKPFSMRELVARLNAVLRRVDSSAASLSSVITVAALELDPAKRRVRWGGVDIGLTPTEFDLLAVLAADPGRVLSRQQLLAEVWGYRDGSGVRTVDSHVRALRRKLGDGVIRTVHGIGYGLEVSS